MDEGNSIRSDGNDVEEQMKSTTDSESILNDSDSHTINIHEPSQTASYHRYPTSIAAYNSGDSSASHGQTSKSPCRIPYRWLVAFCNAVGNFLRELRHRPEESITDEKGDGCSSADNSQTCTPKENLVCSLCKEDMQIERSALTTSDTDDDTLLCTG